jgi:hypothetical protein
VLSGRRSRSAAAEFGDTTPRGQAA